MNWFKNPYNLVFSGFLLSVILVFLYIRPLDSPWDRIINGDGLGYYSYLPAKYIYNDVNYEFKWFNEVYNTHNAPGTFVNPEDNFLVKYGDRKINKYYQGLSFIWLPFFVLAQLYAKFFGYPMDGFSFPYQLFIAFASLFYLFFGLIFLRKLLRKLFGNPYVETLVPIVFFYGTYLFFYSIHFSTLSHIYSFCFSILFVYSLLLFFKDKENKLLNLLLCLLWLGISACIRPLNGMLIFVIPAFIPKGFFNEKIRFEKVSTRHAAIFLLFVSAIVHQLNITHTQTGAFIPDTYPGETFDFSKPVFFDALVSYRAGLFVYVPLLLFSFVGTAWFSRRKSIVLSIFFFGLLYLYSCWWYWPVVKRVMVDFYFIPAIFLGALINRYSGSKQKSLIFGALVLSVSYYQLKNFQLTRGILDEMYTYREVFWRNFFKTHRVNTFLVPPAEIIHQADYTEDFESASFEGNRTNKNKHLGQYSLLLSQANSISRISSQDFPALFDKSGNKKIKISFWVYFSEGVEKLHVFLQFFDKKGKMVEEAPYYVDKEYIYPNTWDYKEFGLELADRKHLNRDNISKIAFVIWNVEGKNNVFVDDAKIEYILAKEDNETFK